MKRRAFLNTIAGSAMSLAVPTMRVSAATKEQVALAGTVSLSGVFANVGTLVSQGSVLGVDVFNRDLPVQLTYSTLDDRSDPGEAVRGVEAALQRNVRYFVDTTNSASALAVARTVNKTGGVYVNQAGADSMTGVDCNRASFRWPVASYGAIEQSVRPLTTMFPKAKRWYTITCKYVFGESLLANTKKVLQDTHCEHVGNSYHSLAEKEFSGYIANAMAQKPDVLCILNFGNQTLDAIRTAVSFGMKSNTVILVPWSTGLDQFQALGSDIVDGIYFGAQYWHDLDTPGNRIFLKAYAEKNKDKPSYIVASGFAAVQMIAEGIRKAGSADYKAVIHAMEGLQYEGVSGTELVRAEDHQVIKDFLLMQGKPKSQMKDPYDFARVVSKGKSFLPIDQTQCKMA